MSVELPTNAADALGRSAQVALGSTVATGTVTWLEVIPPLVGAFVAVSGLLLSAFLAWKKNKLYNLQLEELERHRKNA